MECRSARPLLEAFVDGELSAEQTLEVEAHVDDCVVCAEQCEFSQVLKNSTRRAVHADARVTADFRARLERAMAAELAREIELETAKSPPAAALAGVVPLGDARQGDSGALWRNILPMAVAAALFGLWLSNQQDGSKVQNANAARASVSAGVAQPLSPAAMMDQTLDRLIDYHSSPPTPQVVEEDLVSTFESDVGVRVHAPRLEKFGALWEGASIVPVRNHQAAYLRYRLPDRHVTVYMFDPRKVRIQGHLSRKLVRNHPVYLGHWRGYTVAAKENQGIGYALASDLDDFEMEELITELH